MDKPLMTADQIMGNAMAEERARIDARRREARKGKKLFKTIELGTHFGKTHFKHTLITWLIVVGISAFIYMTRWFAEGIVNMTGGLVLLFLIIVAFTLIEIVVSVWEHIFVFNMYLKNK